MTGLMLDRDRLVKLLGMLGSHHDGDIANAGRAADCLIREAGLRSSDLIRPALPTVVSQPASLIAIAAHTDGNGRAYPSMATIAALTGIRREDVPRAVRRLDSPAVALTG